MEGLSKEELLYDARAERIKQIRLQRQRKMRKRRRIRRLIVLALFIAIACYFYSDLSKVRSLSVSGNRYYSDAQIYELANVSYETRYLLKPAFMMEGALNGDALIESAQVHKDYSGIIHIEVKEKLIVGYIVKEEQIYLLTSEGKQIAVSDAQIASAKQFPLLSGFSDEQLASLAAAFDAVKEEVDADVLSRISEILPYETSFNKNMMRVVMRDGNTLYGSYESAGVMQVYESVLSKLKGNNVCLFMDEENQAMSKISCKEFVSEDTKTEDTKKEDK